MNENQLETNNEVAETSVEKASFDDVLADKEYQKEFDRRLDKAINTAKSKWDAELEAKKSEAEKLANMKAEEKLQYELDKAKTEKTNAIEELEAYKLQNEAFKIANEKGLPHELLNTINFKGNNAESVSTQIDNLSKIFNSALDKALNERLRQSTPKQNLNNVGMDENKIYLANKYKNNPFYKG